MNTTETLAYACLFIFGVILVPVLVQAISSTDMSGWTFAGHEGIATFLQVFPYLFLIAVVLVPVYMIMKAKT